MRLGIGSYTCTWAVGVPGQMPAQPLTPFGLLERACELGLRVVQFCENLPLVRLPDGELKRLAAQAAANGVAIEIGTRGIRDAESLARHLELAILFQSPILRLVVDSPGHEPSPEEIVAGLRPLVAACAGSGIQLALENHDRFPCRVLADIVEQLGPAHAGICLDTVNSFGALEGPEIVVKTLARYALNLHVKDFTIARVNSQMGFAISGCAAGAGRLDIPWLLGELRQAGRDCNAILELWTPPAQNLKETIARENTWIRQSIAYLRQHIPQ